MDWVVKKKSTGEIYTITCIGYSCSENYYTLIGKEGKAFEVKEKKFRKEYEKVEYDFSKIFPVIKKILDLNEDARKLVYSIARRVQEDGYFHVGDLVYFEVDFNDAEYRSTHRPLIITNIAKDYHDEATFLVQLHYYRGEKAKYDSSPDFVLPMHKDRWAKGDAYYYLKRYDSIY